MKRSPSWESNKPSANQSLFNILWKRFITALSQSWHQFRGLCEWVLTRLSFYVVKLLTPRSNPSWSTTHFRLSTTAHTIDRSSIRNVRTLTSGRDKDPFSRVRTNRIFLKCRNLKIFLLHAFTEGIKIND